MYSEWVDVHNMAETKLVAEVRTNVPAASINKQFMSIFTEHLVQTYNTKKENVVVEIHADVMMQRAGTEDPLMNINLYHNCPDINMTSKVTHAMGLAKFMSDKLSIPNNRVMVLFFDTKKCT